MRRIVAQVPLFDGAIMPLSCGPRSTAVSVNVVSSVSEGLGVHPRAAYCAPLWRNQLQASQNPRKIKKASSAFAKEVHVRETGFEPATC